MKTEFSEQITIANFLLKNRANELLQNQFRLNLNKNSDYDGENLNAVFISIRRNNYSDNDEYKINDSNDDDDSNDNNKSNNNNDSNNLNNWARLFIENKTTS